MNLLKDPQTNWSRIIIIAFVASLIGMGIFAYQWWSVREHLKEQTQSLETLSEQLRRDKKAAETIETVIDTSDWQTYRNESFGFKVKYPVVYDTDQQYERGKCSPSTYRSEYFSLFVGPLWIHVKDAQGATLSEYVEKVIQGIEETNKPSKNIFSKLVSRADILLDGREATKVVSEFCGASCSIPVHIYVKNGINIFDIGYDDGQLSSCLLEPTQLPSEVAIQILSSFKFIGQVYASAWKSYQNEKYGYEISYPTDFVIFTSIKVDMYPTVEPVFPKPDANEIRITDYPYAVIDAEPFLVVVKVLDTYLADLDFETWAEEEYYTSPGYREEIINKGYESFLGKRAYRVYAHKNLGSLGDLILVNHNGRTYFISYNNDEAEFLDIVNSFKFLVEDENSLRICPDTWLEFLSPIQVKNNPYYGQEGQFLTINGSTDLIPAKKFDLEWIKQNCEVKEAEPVG